MKYYFTDIQFAIFIYNDRNMYLINLFSVFNTFIVNYILLLYLLFNVKYKHSTAYLIKLISLETYLYIYAIIFIYLLYLNLN